MTILGLDVGGANLKAAHADGAARSRPFALWKQPHRLADALAELLKAIPAYQRLVVTMTGELCDCFASKRDGVAAILDAVEAVADGVPVAVWQTDGRFVDPAAARQRPLHTAAANWLALATYAGRLAPRGPALLLDIGSTTSDLVPLQDGRPVPHGRTDPERLRSNELVYTGVRRTPVCALMGARGAAEFFATTHDVFLVLGTAAEDETDCDTADGRPATRAFAHARLARMLGADLETSTELERRQLAEWVLLRQVHLLTAAIDAVVNRLSGPPQTVVLAGSGEFLAELVLQQQRTFPPCAVVSLARQLGHERSRAACAYALTQIVSTTLASEPRTQLAQRAE